ncbi:hypothetical protein [Brachyspira pilosicoli]|uniref:hypothetical protein n=1 Tax=Brachyspira pilosicoli TaxID=52584 RepID=UPI0012F50CC8
MLFNKKIIYSLITFSFISIFIFSCRSMGNSVVVVDDIISTNRIVAIVSFTFPKSMTNVNIDRLKYLNTEIYTDVVLKSFISNFNSQSELIKLVTLEEALGTLAFSKLPNHYILGSDYVAATGTIATNKLDDDTIALLRDKNISGVMYANSKMSFWAQSIDINFDMYDLNGNNLWLDTLEGYSYYIIGDTGSPTKQMNYQIVIADVVKFQQKHADELYIIIDEAVSNGVYTLKNKVPYAFSTNDILFTQKTFSLTNEEYAKKAGIK